jgi:hypothetical protein
MCRRPGVTVAYSQKNSRGQEYFLHSKKVTLKGGRVETIYYFSRKVDEPNAIDAVPADRMVSENARTGLLLLKKKA